MDCIIHQAHVHSNDTDSNWNVDDLDSDSWAEMEIALVVEYNSLLIVCGF